MAKKPLKRIIKTIENQLSWQVIRTRHPATLDIISDPATQVHTIRYPLDETGPAGKVRETEYLHELGHAYLAERNPVFCVHEFIASGLDINEALPLLSGPVRATADWFVDDLLIQWAPDAELSEIAEHVDLFRHFLIDRDPLSLGEDLYGCALVFAQGVYYLKAAIPLASPLEALVDRFLEVPPRRATTIAFSVLFNGLLTSSGLRAFWNETEAAWNVTKLQRREST